MADICCGVLSESEASGGCGRNSREARRRRIELRRIKSVSGEVKRQKMDGSSSPTSSTSSFPWECENTQDSCVSDELSEEKKSTSEEKEMAILGVKALGLSETTTRFGVSSVCGRRRDMEDAVAVHPCFFRRSVANLHYFAVYDGHGCSHVAMRCRNRLHELVKEELLGKEEKTEESRSASANWKDTLERSFNRMDKEVIIASNKGVVGDCRCELQTPECDAVGSTAVTAIVTPEKIIVANCGDSRAVLCRNGKPVPLSTDHKPDRPDELNRIEEAGGRVIYWDGPRVLGVLAMSRAIGDNYLKPYVSSEPEVTITERTGEDECLILASDGLWDVVSNDTACGVARMCLKRKFPVSVVASPEGGVGAGVSTDKACSDASMLLTKLALARHSTDNVSVVVVNLRKDT